jgi:hypothetical protein
MIAPSIHLDVCASEVTMLIMIERFAEPGMPQLSHLTATIPM